MTPKAYDIPRRKNNRKAREGHGDEQTTLIVRIQGEDFGLELSLTLSIKIKINVERSHFEGLRYFI